MNRLFTSTGYLEADDLSTSLAMHQLPPFLRVLLTTDGTVTKSIESYFWEPLQVRNTGQQYRRLDADAPIIQCKMGERVLRRTVELTGEQTTTCYATAVSLIRTELLSEDLRSSLEAGQVGIGELLRECGLETYREIIAVGESPPGESPMSDHVVWRTYRIVMAHKPFIQITEYFPLNVYRDESAAPK